jgi:plastocyanin
VNGEGGKGATLNRQDKLFAHLSPDYIRTMLQVGGRYACGNPNSIMPVWSNTGSPPGPLNYKQIEDVINFLRADKGTEYEVLDPSLFEPVIDPNTGKPKTFEGWVDPNYTPAPGSTPFPACWQDEFTKPQGSGSPAPSGSAGANGSPTPSGSPATSPGASGSPAPSGSAAAAAVELSALNIAFQQPTLQVPADQPFQLKFNNGDQGVPHDVAIKDASGNFLFKGDAVTGVATTTYDVPSIPAGSYTFVCTIHPNMTGTLTAGS